METPREDEFVVRHREDKLRADLTARIETALESLKISGHTVSALDDESTPKGL